jgi:hypothetical protein
MKTLFLAILLALPLVGGWMWRTSERNDTATGYGPVSKKIQAARPELVVTIPVEVVASGRPPEWVLVQVVDQAGPIAGRPNQTP